MMKNENEKKLIPSPQQRPDLYDDYDVPAQSSEQANPVKVPDRIQKLIAERQAKAAPAQQAAE
jgi:hypothetical protein